MSANFDPNDFSQLSAAEQREVAHRLLKIAESDWKPFWCADSECDGNPHPLLDRRGRIKVFLSRERAPKDAKLGYGFEAEDGSVKCLIDKEHALPNETYLGYVVLDPAWSHNHARIDQRLPAWNKTWTLFIMSGRGCVAPWTLIDLADGTRERIDTLTERGEAIEVMTPDGPRWTEGAPFLKGEAHLWRVRLSNGRVLTVTDEHRFLAPGGWLRLDHVRVGQPLVAAPLDQDGTDVQPSRDGQSTWRSDVRRCWSTELGSGCGCPTCRRPSDLPLPSSAGDDRENQTRNDESGLVWVEAIEYSHFGPYFDMSVPGPESYVSEGVVNHNTGKTKTGVEFVTLCARKGLDGAIIGRRGTELINTHVATIIASAHPEFKPEYLASKDILVWPNGAKTFLFSAERPENIRSVNLAYFWMDEAAFMDEVVTAYMNAKMATRIESPGNPIHVLITSTPTATKWVMEMEDDEAVEIRRVSTYANRANLSKDYIAGLVKYYEGTRMGRQELHGEVLRDVEGSMWNDDIIRQERVDEQVFGDYLDTMDDVVLAIDPAGSKGKHSDATGIIGVGTQRHDENGDPLNASRFFVLADATLKGTPTEWAAQAFKAARLIKANYIVAEKNFGGDMVKQVLEDYAKLNPKKARDMNGDPFTIKVVHAQQSKETRAEATVGRYEQGLVVHLSSPTKFGDLAELEKEQVTWVPKSRGGKSPSPNRVDALVWAIRELDTSIKFETTMGSRDVMKKIKKSTSRTKPRVKARHTA